MPDPVMTGGSASHVGPSHQRNLQIATKALPDSGLPELFSYLQHLTDVNAHSMLALSLDIWPAAYASEPATPVLDPNTKYVLGPDGNPLLDLTYNKPIVDDWYQQLITVQTGIIKGIDATLRKLGLPQAFGWSIVIYTFFIKILTYPFQRSATRSMTLMKVAEPKINQIKEAENLSADQKVELQRKIYDVVGASPLGGCLPILIPLPIYFTLIGAWRRLAYEKFPYYTESWLWVPSLAQPNPSFNLSLDWLFQFNANGEPLMGWHDYLSYLVFPVVLVTNTLILAFQSAKKEGKNEGPPVGITLFTTLLVGSISLDLPQAYAVYYLANQVLSVGQTYLATESMRGDLPGFEEYKKTGQFPAWAADNMALLQKVPTSLHEAARSGNNDAVIAFLEEDSVDIDAWDEAAKVTPIGYAVAMGHLSTVRLLMSRGANIRAVDGAGHTLFHFAAFYGQSQVMRELVEVGKEAYPDNSWAVLKDRNGLTPLDAASNCEFPEIIDLFEGLGLNTREVPQPVVPAPTSLHEASRDGNNDAVIAFLENASVDIDAWDETAKVTPIGYAVAMGHLSTLKLLISRGANIRAVDGAGHTLFHFAAFYGQTQVMRELVEVGKEAYPDNSWAVLEDRNGHTPLDLVSLRRDPNMMDLLRGLGLESPQQPEPVTTGEVLTDAKAAAAAVAMAGPTTIQAVTPPSPPLAKPVPLAARAVD